MGEKLNRLLGVIRKGDKERIQVEVTEYKGHPYIDIRTYERKGDGWYPTTKGITVRHEMVDELIMALAKVVMVTKETLIQ